MANKMSGKKWLLVALAGIGLVFLLTWGLARLIAGLFPDDSNPTEPMRTTRVTPNKRITKYKLITIEPPKERTGKSPVRARAWVGKKPNLPSHDELMRRVRAKRTYAKDLPPVARAGSKHYRIKRDALKEWLKKPLGQNGATWYPHYDRGRPSGMKVREIQPGSFMARLGLYKGDILMSVNGRQILSPSHAHKRYNFVAKRSRNLTLKFKRGGKEHTVDFDLK